MPKINRDVKHSLEIEAAKELMGKIVEDIKSSYPSLVSTITWNSDRTQAEVKGKLFKGKFNMSTSQMSIKLDLSWAAKPFMKAVESKIDGKIKEYFG